MRFAHHFGIEKRGGRLKTLAPNGRPTYNEAVTAARQRGNGEKRKGVFDLALIHREKKVHIREGLS